MSSSNKSNYSYRVLIPDVLNNDADIEKNVFGTNAKIILGKAKLHSDIKNHVWKNCDAVLAWDTIDYNENLISKLQACKVIVRVGVGYDNVDLVAAKKNNIVVCNVPDYGTEEVADHAIALFLSLNRGLQEYSQSIKDKNWIRSHTTIMRLTKKVMGIIGLGRIGLATALRAVSFGMKIIFYDPYLPDGYDKALNFKRVDTLNEIAEESDVISIHTPLTEETYKMINKKFLRHVKKKPIILNTARGPIIDLPSLENSMRENKVKAAGLDVLPVEPSDDSQQLIVDYENNEEWLKGRLIVTPHVAFYSPESFKEMRRKAAEEAMRVLNGENPRNPLSI